MNLVSPAAGLSRVSLLVRYATRLPFIVAVVAGFLALTPSDGLALSVGDRVVVACSNPQGVRVRSTAMLSEYNIIGGVFDGATGSVVNGPVYRDGYTWVRVSWDNSASPTGWSANCWLVQELTRPTLSSPPSNGTIQGSSVTFSWTASGSPSGYNLRVGTSPGSGNILDLATISPSYTATGLQSGTYYWQVLSIKPCPSCSERSGGAFSPFSFYRSFTVSAVPQTFDLVPDDVYFTTQPNGGGTRTDSPSAGQSLYPAFQYRVSGSGGSKTGTLAEMWLGSTSLGTITGTANPSAGTVVRGLSSPVTIPSGSFVLKVKLDPQNDFQDTKSSNNVFTRSYNVAPPSSFDFQIKDVYLGDSSGRKVTTPSAGERLYPAVKYSLSVSKGSFVGRAWRIDYDANAPIFAPSGTSSSAVDRVAVSPTAVTVSEDCHTLSATLNPDGIFGETNTGNNHMSLPPFVAKKSGQPDPPSGVSATQGTLEDRVQVTWPASSGAAKYRIYVSPGPSGFLTETAQQRFDHGAAKVGTVYTYSVSGVTLSGVEGPRSCVSATGWRKGTAPVTMKVEPLTGLFFNLVGVGQSRDLKIKISNIGGGTLTGSISGLPQGFSVVGSSAFSIPAGQPPQELTVRFQPSTKKVYEGNAVVSGGSSTVVVPLKGEGGQLVATGSIRCTIKDQFGRPVRNATVESEGKLFSEQGNGVYSLTAMSIGNRVVVAHKPTFPNRFLKVQEDVMVRENDAAQVRLDVQTEQTRNSVVHGTPLILVRGLDLMGWDDEVLYWNELRERLGPKGAGFTEIWDCNVENVGGIWTARPNRIIDGKDSLVNNADRLKDHIVEKIRRHNELHPEEPVTQINFVCHSMGGLVVRQLLMRHSEVAGITNNVVLIATPNAGSPLAELALGVKSQLSAIFDIAVSGIVAECLKSALGHALPEEALSDLRVGYVEKDWGPDQTYWDTRHRLFIMRGAVPYLSINGLLYKPLQHILALPTPLGRDACENDGVVPYSSGHGKYFYYLSALPQTLFGRDLEFYSMPGADPAETRSAALDHTAIRQRAEVLDVVKGWLENHPSRSSGIRFGESRPTRNVEKDFATTSTQMTIAGVEGVLEPGGVVEVPVSVDGSSTTVFRGAFGDENVSFTLTAPNALVVTQASAGDVGISFQRMQVPNSSFVLDTFAIPVTSPGTWVMRAQSTGETTQPVTVKMGAQHESTMALLCDVPIRARNGQSVVLTARLMDLETDTCVVLPATVMTATLREPGGSISSHGLADDGLSGDGDPFDGVYGVALDGLSTPGLYMASCNASGVAESARTFSRVSGWSFNVAEAHGRLTGELAYDYVDLDGDGSTDTLKIGVGVSLDRASTCSVSAKLSNAASVETVNAVRYFEDLSYGEHSVDLLFDLTRFVNPDEVGPFTVRDLLLSEETTQTLILLDKLPDTFAIPAVSARRPVVVDFQTTGSAAWEGQSASIQIALTRKSDQPVSVMLAPVGGTASGAGVDYFLDPVRVDFLPGEVSRTVTVPIVDDALMEGNETVEIVLSAPENALLGSATTHTLTILDDDLPDVAVAVRPWPDPPEKGGVAEFTVTARNKGRADATGVAVAVELSPNLAFESAYAVDGTVQGMPPGAVWAVGPLAMGQVTTMTLRARQLDNAYSGTTVTATLAQPDLAPLDNTASWNGTPVEMEIVLLPGGVPLEMVRIPAGSFLMGSPSDPGWSRPNESPQHPVRIGYDYLAGRYEITQEQWTALSTTSPALAHGTGANLPIHNLSWDEIAGPGGFVERLNAHVSATGQGESTFRLPSESEWEYMCRANSTTRFWFGDSNCDPLGCTDCMLQGTDWYCSTEFSPPGVKPVHSLTPNPFGLFHVHGNVHEWCADTYRADHGNAPADGSAWLDFGGGSHVIRGGAFDSPPVACRSAHRGHPAEWPDNSSFGFRLVRTIPSTRADLAVSLTAAPNPVAPGYPVTFSLTARNLGPMGVEDVILTQTLPAGVTVEDFQCAGGTAAVVGADKVVFEWPWLARDASATASLTLVQADAGTLNTTATVTGQCLDTTRTNNVASASVLVSGPAIAVSPSLLAAAGILGQDAPAGTLNVRNMGAGFMSYTIASDAPWLSVTPASGDSSGEVDPIVIHYATAAMPTGEHRANLTITSAEACNSPLVVPVLAVIKCNAPVGPAVVYFNDFETAVGPGWSLGSGTFSDDFNRPDSTEIGNGWSEFPGSSGDDISISGGQLVPSGQGGPGIYRPWDFTRPVSIKAQVYPTSGFCGNSRFSFGFSIRNSGSNVSGYEIHIGRSDSCTPSSTVALYDNGVAVAVLQSSFLFQHTTLNFSATFNPDGSISGTVAQPNNSFMFTFPARAVVSNGNYAAVRFGQVACSGGCATIDNVEIGDPVPTGPPQTAVTPTGLRRFFGQFGNDEVRLSLQDLPPHERLVLSFDLFVIQSWNGAAAPSGPDYWECGVLGGSQFLRTTFSNITDPASPSHLQSFPCSVAACTNPAQTGATEKNTLGYPGTGDSVYRFSFPIVHNQSDATFVFKASNLEELADESWGLDNVKVTIGPPESDVVSLPGGVPLEMVVVPPGTFQMGSDEPGWSYASYQPTHPVTIPNSFSMGTYEITQDQYLAVMGDWPDPANRPNASAGLGPSYPAYNVSWNDISKSGGFLDKLNHYIADTGQGPASFRFPSEAEWEYACRAGSAGRFSFGQSDCPALTCGSTCLLDQYAWYWCNSWGADVLLHPVGGKLPNAFGLFDMYGHVWEWCRDWDHASYVNAPSDGSAWLYPVGSYRIARGGSVSEQAHDCQSASRNWGDPNTRGHNIGFRVVRTTPSGYPDGVQGVGIWSSADGVSWAPHAWAPFKSTQPWESGGVHSFCLHKPAGNSGSYLVYNSGGYPSPESAGLATCQDSSFQWSKLPGNPIVAGQGGWQPYIRRSIMLRDDVDYKVYYSAMNPNPLEVGLATSTDGVSWVQGASPVLSRAMQSWSSFRVVIGSVLKVGETYYAYYYGDNQNLSAKGSVGLATSSDGVLWTAHPSNPVVPYSSVPGEGGLGDPHVVYEDGLFRMFVRASGVSGWVYGTSTDGVSWSMQIRPEINLPSSISAVQYDGQRYYASGGITNDAMVFSESHVTRDAAVVCSPVGSIWQGDSATLTLSVSNAGAAAGTGLELNWPLPSGLAAISATVSQGTVSVLGNSVLGSIGTLDVGTTATVNVTVRADQPGVFTSLAHLTMSECDDNSMNNDATVTVIVKPRANVGVSVGPLATPAVVGATVGIPVAVTNHGPGDASDVVLTATLSAGAVLERVEKTTGTATAVPGGAANWHCGALGAGQTTTVTLFVKPDAAALASGRLTVEAQVASTAPVDHVPGNNRASATARVIRDFVDLGEGVLLELVHVPEGSYLPGPDDPDWGTAGGTTVTVEEDYYIGRFEVTQAQWQRLIAENPATGAGTGQNVPVYNVSWSDLTSAGGFIARLNDHVTSTGQGPATFRLPTEAQWELACRAGSEARFSFGDSDCTTDTCGSCSLGEYAWYCGNNGAQGAADFGAKAVGTRLPNALDIFDMHGNVAEWCSDETSTDPVAMRAVRGGDWASQPLYAACSFRDGADANLRSPTIGFRVLRTRPLAPMADLKIAADVSPTVTRPDYPTTFTLTVSNAGPDVANDVVVTSTLTSNLTVASAESTSGTLVETGGVLICDLGRMEVGTTETITIVALADPVAPGTTANAAITAVAGASEHDPDPASNATGAAAVVRDDIVILPGEIPLELVPVSAGTFVMGAGLDPGWSGPTEGPEHEVTLGYGFHLGKHEVTQAQWRALMATSPASGYGEGPNHPVYSVSWNEIAGPDGFIARLNRHIAATRQGPGSFRLPSEAEWEYGCRASAGPATRFSFGDSNCGPDLCGGCDLDDHAWYCGNNGFPGAPDFGAKPVGGRTPNALGAHDMHGNVAEWCADWWHADYNGAPVDGRVWADPQGSNRVVRGGNWAARPAQVASAYRGDSAPPDSRSVTVGFRVARGEPTTTTLSDLQITLEADPEPVLAGDALLYFLTVTNHGPDMANDIVLTQTLPLNAVFLADHSTTGLMGEDGMVTASLGALGAGAAAEMVVAVQPTDEGLLLSGAEVSVSETDHNPSNNSDVVATRVIAVGDLAVESVASSGTVVQGGAAVWSDVVTNHGPSTARGALLWHALADGMEFDASRSTPGMTKVSGGLVALELGDLASGASTTVTVAARATIVGDTLTTAAAAVEVFDPMLDNNIATTTLVVSPNTAPAAGIQPVGGPVMSPVPLDFSLHDAESDPCRLEAAYSLDGGGVWTTATVAGPITGLGSSPFGVAHTVAWDAMADLGTTWGVVARLRITPSDEWQTGTAAETDAFTVDTVIPSADLAVTKTGVPDSVEVTGVATYTVGVTNRGPASAPDVVVADTLLTGMELVSASVTTGTVGIADQLVTATVTALEPGEATTMTLQVRMAKPGIFVNAASALSSRPDPVPANNTAFAQTTVTLGCTSRDELLTTAGWELFLKEPNEMDPQYADFSGIDYDPANSALRCRVSSDPGTAGTDAAPLNGAVGLFRAAGWKTRDPYAAATLPYASIGTNGVARTKWFVYATGNEPAQVNTIPATRMMIHNRFIVSTTLEVFTHVNDGTASFNGNVLGQDIAPSTDPERPSLYRCDYDPVDAPFLIANSQTEGLSRGFIAQGDKPQDNGYICLAETVTACYPKVLTDGMLVQRLLPSASDAGALRIAGVKPVSDVGGSVHLRFSYPFNEASGRISMVDFDSGPTMTEGPFGVTLDSTEYDNQPVGNPPMGTRAGILLLGFYPGDDLAARPRVEPGKQYRVRFHVTGTQQSNLQAQLRLQVNTGANTYAQKYELGGPQSGGAQAQQLAKEVLPGIGNSNPSGEYDLLMYTPLSLGIRPDAPDIKSAFPNWMLFAGPGIDDSGATAYPPGLNRRDLRIQVVLIDTLSYGPKAILEKGNYTIDRIEVYAQDAVDDGSPM